MSINHCCHSSIKQSPFNIMSNSKKSCCACQDVCQDFLYFFYRCLFSHLETTVPPILPPTVTFCPDDITMTSFSGNGLAVNFPQPTARTQSGLLANVVSQSAFPGDTFPVGKTVVRYVFRDQQQPTSSQVECTFCIEICKILSS